jgi:hypothetical protein
MRPMTSRLPVDPEGPRHEPTASQQPEAVARLGLATPREFLQEGCGAAAKDVTNLRCGTDKHREALTGQAQAGVLRSGSPKVAVRCILGSRWLAPDCSCSAV